jgi:hypothetical protein
MKTPISMTRCAIHYTEKERLTTDTKHWFSITVSKIYGRRHLYTDLQEYIRTHSKPGIIIPDARVVTQDVAQQISHFMIRNRSLGMIVLYDRPNDVPEVFRYFVPLLLPEITKDDSKCITHTNRIVESLANAGFLSNERTHKYLVN